VEDELVLPEKGRAARTVLVVEPLVTVFPDDLCFSRVDAGGSKVAKMAVEPAGGEDRRGGGVRVERVDRLRIGDDHQFDVVQEFPRVAVDADRME
jgi:hypothetical protein